MYDRNSQRQNEERYERKLELIQTVRAENQANQERIRHRNYVFYNVTGDNSPNAPNEGIQEDSMPLSKWQPMLGIRVCISALCVLSFWGLKEGKIQNLAGLNAKEIKAYVAQDFSKVVVDYMKNFTYTLNYEKTSIE